MNASKHVKISLLIFALSFAQATYADKKSEVRALTPPQEQINAILTPSTAPCGEHGYDISITTEGDDQVLHIRPVGTPQFTFPARECKLWKLKKGMKLYHWGDPDFIQYLAKKGKYSESDYTFWRNKQYEQESSSNSNPTPHGSDWGFYMSVDPWDSYYYGPHLIISTLDQDVLMINPQQCTPAVPAHEDLLNLWQEAGGAQLKKLGIVGTRQDYTPNWLFSIDERATSNMREATASDFTSDEGMGRQPRSLEDWVYLSARYPLKENSWLRQHYPIFAALLKGDPLTPSDQSAIIEEAKQLVKGNEKDSIDIQIYKAFVTYKNVRDDGTALGVRLRQTGYLKTLQDELRKRILAAGSVLVNPEIYSDFMKTTR